MSVEKIDYATIISDLEAKREALENAITSLRLLAASGAIGPSDGTVSTFSMPFSTSGVGEVPDGAFHGKSMPEAIKLYLNLMHKKQSAREISDGLKKGGMESTSKWFDKIVYATLDRLRKAGDVLKIEGNWGLPEWYPALKRAGIGDNNQKQKRKRRSRKPSTNSKGQKLLPSASNEAHQQSGFAKAKGSKSEPGPSDMIDWFLRDTPGSHSFEEMQAASGVENRKVVTMLIGKLIKNGKIEKTVEGKYRKAS